MAATKFIIDVRANEELAPLKLVVTPEMVEMWGESCNNHHPWHTQASPFGGRIAQPTIVMPILLMVRALTCPDGSGPFPLVHRSYEATNASPCKVGERIEAKGKCLARYSKRGREYAEWELVLTGEDGRLISRYKHTICWNAMPSSESEKK